MELRSAVVRYARRFAVVHRVGHSVSSPLGAWLVLALAAQASDGQVRADLEELLGVDAGTASEALDDLLRDAPDVVRAAVAAWGIADDVWVGRLPDTVETGPVPTQPQADAWADEKTDGLIQEFPLDVTTAQAVFASAVATRVSWREPFGLIGAAELRSPWSTEIATALVDDDEPHCFLADTEHAGIVAVHTAYAEGALQVTSVIAGRDVDPRTVLDAAHDIAVAGATGRWQRRHSLFDEDLGDGEFWTIAEADMPFGGEHFRAVLPAWQAQSGHDLVAHPELGFGAAGRALAFAGDVVDAKQVAVARYGQYGFEAAAITAMSARGMRPPSEPARVATLRFGHPYAVVAVTFSRRDDDPWAGMPVFAAWVAEPSDAAAVTTGRPTER
jgi:hypothetical protein